MLSIYRVSGKFRMGEFIQKFSIEVIAENEDKAKEYTYSILGSKHKVKRYHIWIQDIQKISPDEAEDPRVAFKYKLLTEGQIVQ
ncbi:MAG TPA: 50S ribosomal protein L18a [Euryarchaeota archaeon]|nr:50S ribosomal protein L18a [Euryarchaeota archaeon]HHC19403.1 50S ribosomal protein L18a [Euryarchaeota archaeon]